MRHFIVLGFESNSNSAPGEQVHIGSDRGEAIEVTNDPAGGFARKELYELAIPHICRHFSGVTKKETSAEPEQVEEQVDTEEDTETELPEMTNSARELAEENGLTPEQIAEITPTGTTGKILKEDVEDYLDPPEEGDE